jgi:hypothetical protein
MSKLILILLNTLSIATSVLCTFIGLCLIVGAFINPAQGPEGLAVLLSAPFLLLAWVVELVRCEGNEFNV